MIRPRVVIESPFGTRPDGSRASPEEVERNKDYLRRCMLDSLGRGEAPFASHALYTQYLDDANHGAREVGIESGFSWGEVAQFVAAYIDHGITPGMRRGLERAAAAGQAVLYRTLEGKAT